LSFDFGCCSGDKLCGLLPAIFQASAYHQLAADPLPFQPLFTETCHGDQLLAPCPYSSVLSASPPPLLCASFQFIVYSVFFSQRGVILPRGLCWFIPGVAGGIPHDALRSPVWSAKCVPNVFGAGFWWWQEPSCFLSKDFLTEKKICFHFYFPFISSPLN
jgi:hypothetical protein